MSTIFTTRGEFIEALRAGLRQALAGGVNEIFCSDVDFADWPLDEPSLLEALTAWAEPNRRLVMLATSYDEVRRRHPRFVRWRVTWSHLVQAWTPSEISPDDLPCVLLAGTTSVELLDRAHWRGRISHEASQARQCREALDVILQRSVPAFAASTLGL